MKRIVSLSLASTLRKVNLELRMRSNLITRIVVVLLALAVVSACLGQAARRAPQSEPLKKTQPVPSETTPNNADQNDQSVKLLATVVTVPVIASDHDGRYITDMRREEFSLEEDGLKQEIVFFATVNEPFHVVLMIDTSASAQEKLGQIRRAAATFVEQLKPSDRVKVISFDDEVRDLCEFTNDRAELSRAIDQTRPGHGTKMYDAFAHALREMQSIQGRKAIVLFTDGVDMVSTGAHSYDNISGVEESGVIVYPIRYDTRAETEAMLRSQSGAGGVIKRPPIGTTPPTVPGGDNAPQLPPLGPPGRDPRFPPMGSPFPPRNPPTQYPGGRSPDDRYPDSRYPTGTRPDVGNTDRGRYPKRDDGLKMELDARYEIADRYLADLAAKSGGKLMRADTLYSLPAAFAQIAAELRTQYALGYYPSNTARDGSYRKIKVSTKRKGVVIRARPGYRASAGS